jgi:hypothetical protein
MAFSASNSFIGQRLAANGTLTGVYELAESSTDVKASYVRIWATVELPVTITIRYLSDLNVSGATLLEETYTINGNNTSTINSVVKKDYVFVRVVNGSTAQTVTVRTKYDVKAEHPFLSFSTDDIVGNVNVDLENLQIIGAPLSYVTSSIQAYGIDTTDQKRPILTDASGKLIISDSGPISISGPVSITGPVYITDPVSISGTVDVLGIVSIDGNVNCNINPDQYVGISGTVLIDGEVIATIAPNQNVGITGPVSISGTVSCNIIDTTVIDSYPLSISGSVSCNINEGQFVGISGSAYTSLTEIQANTTVIADNFTLLQRGTRGNMLTNASIAQYAMSTVKRIDDDGPFGIDSVICYSDENGSATGNIIILGSPLAGFLFTQAEFLGTLTPIPKYNTSGALTGRWSSTRINVAPFRSLAIQNMSNGTLTGVYCSIYAGKKAGP